MPPDRTPTSALPLRTEVLQILLALAPAPLHGYAVMQRVEAESGGAVVPQAGAFYRTMRNMLADGLVDECAPPEPAGQDARPRRFYRLTPLGRSVARAEVDRLAQVVRLGRSRAMVRRPR